MGNNVAQIIPRVMSSKKKQQKQIRRSQKSSNEPQIDVAPASLQAHLPLELQQAVLDVFANALQLADTVDLFSTIQQVKSHLYDRDFLSAFGKEDNLTAYALRWSAGRALAYAEIFAGLDSGCLAPLRPVESTTSPKVVCLGGGAGAELVALAAVVRHLRLPELHVHAVDIADWCFVLTNLLAATEQRPPLSAYASASAKASANPLLETDHLTMSFERQDVLEYPSADDSNRLQSMLAGASLVTIMFTLNELFTSSISKTTALLLALSDVMDPGSCLLVVDSPGSYSEVSIGGSQKRYPMQWLLKHTLLDIAATQNDHKWTQRFTDDSRWFRIDPKLKYSLELENMRYQMHLYQRSETMARDADDRSTN